MISVVADRSPEYEKLFQYGLEKKKEGSPESMCLKLMRWYNSTQIKPSLSAEEVEEVHSDIFHEEPEPFSQETTMEEDPLARFHLFNKGKATDVFDAEIFEYLRERENIFVIGQVPYVYRSGVYIPDLSGAILKTEIKSLVYKRFIKAPIIDRVYKLFLQDADLQIKADEVNRYPPEWINFLNGFYDPISGELIPHDPEYRAINQIPWEYHPGEKVSGVEVEKWLRFITPNPEDRQMLLEYCGYCLTRDTRQQKFLILVGSGGSGKSTLIRLLETILGEDNLSHVSLRELSQRFASYGLLGKLCNSCADLETGALEDTSVLKKLLGEDAIRAEAKGKDAISFKSYAKMLFSTNELPLVLSERSNGFFRRVMVLTMNQKPEKARADFLDVLQGEADYFLRLCVSALVRMYADGKIHESPASIEAVKSLRNDSDSVQAFLSANIDKSEEGRIKKKDLYTGYEQFCRDADRQSLTKSNFFRSMKAKGFSEIKTGGVECYKGIFWKENLPFFSPEISLTDWSGLPDSSNPFTQGWKREKSGRI